MIRVVKICPSCNSEYTDHPAISRRDNKTEICPPCGTREAILDSDLTYSQLQPSIEEYKRLCISLLKRFDEEYRTRKRCLPYSQETLETLLFYIPALVTDGDLTEKESKRITTLIQRQLSRHEKDKAPLIEPMQNK